MKHFEADRDWALVAPWWSWPDPADSVGGRLTRPVLQKYDSADLVNTFLADPQKRLKFSDEDLVQQVERVFDVPTVGGRKFCTNVSHRFLHGHIAGIEMFRQPQKMEIRAVIHNRAANGDAYGAAEISHHIEQPAGIFQAIGRETAQPEMHRGRDRENLGKSAQNLRKQQFACAPFMREESEIPHRQTKARHAKHHQPARIKSFCQRDVKGNSNQ